MPALVGPIVGFALGVALAWVCRREAPREEDAALRPRLLLAALFGALVFAPVCGYFVLFAGDWALFYLIDSRAVPSAAVLLLLVADALAVPAGFWAGYRSARRHEDRLLTALGVVPAALALAAVAAFQRPLRVDGTFQQVSAGFGTRSVAGGPLGYAVLWMAAMVVAGFAIAARAQEARPRAVPPPPREPPRPGTPPGEPRPRPASHARRSRGSPYP